MRSRERGQYLAMNLHDRDMIRKGRKEGAVEAARNALAMNLTAEQAVQITGLPLEQVLKLQKDFAPVPAN